MRTLIKGGTIVTAEQEYVGDILVDGDVIRAMGHIWTKLQIL